MCGNYIVKYKLIFLCCGVIILSLILISDVCNCRSRSRSGPRQRLVKFAHVFYSYTYFIAIFGWIRVCTCSCNYINKSSELN